jgi:hypothetical protein
LRKKILSTGKTPSNWETVINNIPDDWFPANSDYKAIALKNTFKAFSSIEIRVKVLTLFISEKLKVSNMYLSSNEMYGNPYNFQSYFE